VRAFLVENTDVEAQITGEVKLALGIESATEDAAQPVPEAESTK
jgi:hypothetical protein